MSCDGGYLLDNRQRAAGTRLGVLAALFDPVTVRHLADIGVGDGWRCWEVGAGGPSLPAWLAARVGPSGHVLATDIDTSRLTTLDDDHATGRGNALDDDHATGRGFEVRRHDVGAEPPPGCGFDLVHARLVLAHVPRRDAALSAMVTALRPGGWLLLEDADPMMQPLVCPDESGEPQRLANRLKRAFRTLMAGRGVDLAYGRTLPRLLREAGLTGVQADGYFPVTGPACTLLEQATIAQLRERLVDSGLATDDEIDRHLANIAAGDLDLAASPLVSAWGRKPA